MPAVTGGQVAVTFISGVVNSWLPAVQRMAKNRSPDCWLMYCMDPVAPLSATHSSLDGVTAPSPPRPLQVAPAVAVQLSVNGRPTNTFGELDWMETSSGVSPVATTWYFNPPT